MTITVRIRASTQDFGRGPNIQSMTLLSSYFYVSQELYWECILFFSAFQMRDVSERLNHWFKVVCPPQSTDGANPLPVNKRKDSLIVFILWK